jgi:hypothetical protein
MPRAGAAARQPRRPSRRGHEQPPAPGPRAPSVTNAPHPRQAPSVTNAPHPRQAPSVTNAPGPRAPSVTDAPDPRRAQSFTNLSVMRSLSPMASYLARSLSLSA